jgi:hypothetical protein
MTLMPAGVTHTSCFPSRVGKMELPAYLQRHTHRHGRGSHIAGTHMARHTCLEHKPC